MTLHGAAVVCLVLTVFIMLAYIYIVIDDANDE